MGNADQSRSGCLVHGHFGLFYRFVFWQKLIPWD